LIKERTGKTFPTDPMKQLEGAISAVFGSWMNERAILYRQKYRIPDEWGTAVNVQSMVFGNMGDDCATGVAFTRDPATGENVFYGEYLVNAQGEDVVAGVRTPLKIAEMAKHESSAQRTKNLSTFARLWKRTSATFRTSSSRSKRRSLYMLANT
jgi:pyruvate,orthophosphate dikinase